jgi:hypothetical protein
LRQNILGVETCVEVTETRTSYFAKCMFATKIFRFVSLKQKIKNENELIFIKTKYLHGLIRYF